jgi:hypothetical protein
MLPISGFHNMNVFICGIINYSKRVLPHVERGRRENTDKKAGEKEL